MLLFYFMCDHINAAFVSIKDSDSNLCNDYMRSVLFSDTFNFSKISKHLRFSCSIYWTPIISSEDVSESEAGRMYKRPEKKHNKAAKIIPGYFFFFFSFSMLQIKTQALSPYCRCFFSLSVDLNYYSIWYLFLPASFQRTAHPRISAALLFISNSQHSSMSCFESVSSINVNWQWVFEKGLTVLHWLPL